MDSETLTQLLANKYGTVLDAQIEAFVAEFNENAKITLQNELPKQYVEKQYVEKQYVEEQYVEKQYVEEQYVEEQYVEKQYVEELGEDDAQPIPNARKRKFDEFSRNLAVYGVAQRRNKPQ